MTQIQHELFGSIVEFPSKSNAILLEIPQTAYSKEAVLQSAYTYMDRFYIYLDMDKKKTFKIYFRPIKSQKLNNPTKFAGEFLNELLHQNLRTEIQGRTAKVKELIIGRALFGAERPANAPETMNTDQLASPQDNLDTRPQIDENWEPPPEELAELEKLLEEPIEDLEDIAVPWEEKYGKSRNDD